MDYLYLSISYHPIHIQKSGKKAMYSHKLFKYIMHFHVSMYKYHNKDYGKSEKKGHGFAETL